MAWSSSNRKPCVKLKRKHGADMKFIAFVQSKSLPSQHECLHMTNCRACCMLPSQSASSALEHASLCQLAFASFCAGYRSFYEQLELLLDESILVGRGRTCIAELRPLAFSMLAELIHHVRQDLKLPQLVRIIYLFSRWGAWPVLCLLQPVLTAAASSLLSAVMLMAPWYMKEKKSFHNLIFVSRSICSFLDSS